MQLFNSCTTQSRHLLSTLWLIWLAFSVLSISALAQDNHALKTDSLIGTPTDTTVGKVDEQAKLYVLKCAGCHTIGGGKLTGPDLIVSSTWSDNDLFPAIKRMEKNVGPLDDSTVKVIAEFMRDPNQKERLQKAEEQIAQMELSQLEPASAALGKRYYEGSKPLKNGGSMCMGCHKFNGSGGILGPDLSKSFEKMGQVGMMSAIEQATFKVMDATYRNHKITKQEAVHLTAYLSTGNTPIYADDESNWILYGIGISVLLFLIFAFLYRYRVKPFQHIRQRR